jgi:hypothetical protein
MLHEIVAVLACALFAVSSAILYVIVAKNNGMFPMRNIHTVYWLRSLCHLCHNSATWHVLHNTMNSNRSLQPLHWVQQQR